MSDKSRAAWSAILAKKKTQKLEPTTNEIVTKPVTKSAATCGTTPCCMGQARDMVTTSGISMIGPGGIDMGSTQLPRGVALPMLCNGRLWTPKQPSQWDRKRQERKDNAALSEFKKK